MSKPNTTADERLSEHARYLATVLTERAAAGGAATTTADCETVAHLWLLGSYRKSTVLRPLDDDVDLTVSFDVGGDHPADEVLERLRAVLSAHARVAAHRHDDEHHDEHHDEHRRREDPDAVPVERCSYAEPGEAARSEQIRHLVRLAKWIMSNDRTPDHCCPPRRDHLATWRPQQAEIEILLLLLAARSSDQAEIRRCSANVVPLPYARCAGLADAVDVDIESLPGEDLTRVWRVASERYQQTLDKVRLLEQSSLGAARSRASRRHAPPRAVREVLKRAGVGTDQCESVDPA